MKTILVSAKLCYVCNKNIKNGQEIYIGQGNYRHPHCAPGKTRWLNSRHVQSSPYRYLWQETSKSIILTGYSPSKGIFRLRVRDKKNKNLMSDSRQLTLF